MPLGANKTPTVKQGSNPCFLKRQEMATRNPSGALAHRLHTHPYPLSHQITQLQFCWAHATPLSTQNFFVLKTSLRSQRISRRLSRRMRQNRYSKPFANYARGRPCRVSRSVKWPSEFVRVGNVEGLPELLQTQSRDRQQPNRPAVKEPRICSART